MTLGLLAFFSFVILLKHSLRVLQAQLPVFSAGILGVGQDDLVEQHLAQNILVERVLLELKVVVRDGLAFFQAFVGWIVDFLEEWMLQALLGCQPFFWLPCKQF